MSKTISSDYAFNFTGRHNDPLTKREYFAAMAMQGLVSNVEAWKELPPEDITDLAVYYANTLIAALNEVPEDSE